jgi:hypothetical protein
VSQSLGFVSPEYFVRFASCLNRAGNLAVRIASLKMRGPEAWAMCCDRARGRTYCLSVGGTARLDLNPIVPSASRVALASTLAPTRSRTNGALVPPCGLGGVGPYTDGALFGGGRSPWHLAHESWCCDTEHSAFCTTTCSMSPRTP